MPMLDVSFVTFDPMLADTFDVRRRLNIVDPATGRVTAVPDQVFLGEFGVVTQQDPATLLRAETGQTFPKRIFIASMFQFLALAKGQQPDEVTWDGIVYTVESVLPYSRYGGGTYEAICEFRGNVPPAQ